MSRFGWRLLFVAAFLPLALPVVLWSACALAAAGVAWLFAGSGEQDGKDRSERWAFGRTGAALSYPLDMLMRKADVLREFWAERT